MRITFEHIFGVNNQADFQYYIAGLEDVAPEEHDAALEQGWLAECKNNQIKWYQTRSTRICLSDHNFAQYDPNRINSEIFPMDQIPRRTLDHIYDSYCYHKKFKKYFEVDEYHNWDRVIGYRDQGGDLCAYSKLRHYSNRSIETLIFAWDYKNPELELGKQSLWWELDWCQKQGYQYTYVGSAYETSSLYKADYPGFEWWTGQQWSSDIDHYRWLLKRDSKLGSKKISDLHGLQIDP